MGKSIVRKGSFKQTKGCEMCGRRMEFNAINGGYYFCSNNSCHFADRARDADVIGNR